jgi:uncharacterized cysteine cluster protein YcgN (CxxCxxCC family)
MSSVKPWWEIKHLNEMTRFEWEQICDHCGKCCLHKLEDEADGTIYYTEVACSLLDADSCHCTDYQNRQTLVPTCLQLTANNLDQIQWMPPSCSYRLLREGRPLAAWHHLITADKASIHQQGQSIKGKYIDEKEASDLEEHVVEWPLN